MTENKPSNRLCIKPVFSTILNSINNLIKSSGAENAVNPVTYRVGRRVPAVGAGQGRIRFKHYSIRTERAYLDWI